MVVIQPGRGRGDLAIRKFRLVGRHLTRLDPDDARLTVAGFIKMLVTLLFGQRDQGSALTR
jgi:hypothetical protein